MHGIKFCGASRRFVHVNGSSPSVGRIHRSLVRFAAPNLCHLEKTGLSNRDDIGKRQNIIEESQPVTAN